jgi:DNA-binding NtrC family response regulator
MTTTGSILLVDDEEKILKTLGRALRDEGHRVVERGDAREARSLIGEGGVDVLVVDNLMPGLTGLELIRDVVATVSEPDRPQIVMMTAHATVADAIEAMKLGALDFLQKPFEIDHLLVTVSRAVEHQRLRTQHRYLLTERDEEFNHYGIVGRSRSMQDVIRRAERVAETRSTVLITGETGTGKELVARAIHDRSAQRHMPLIKINCAAIPETLLESELFGHVRGAFTGATTNKKGRFALANGGSIFLDEIGIMPSALQPKLLRVVQEREFEPLGSERTERVDVRVIAATNRNLSDAVAGGQFREDLLYRLRVIHIHVPPLRERREDIRPLVKHLVEKSGREADFSEAAHKMLERYRWPGNVRELQNVIERAVALADGPVVEVQDVPLDLMLPDVRHLVDDPTSLPLREARERFDRQVILRVLERVRWNQSEAARLLGLHRNSLKTKLLAWGIDPVALASSGGRSDGGRSDA